MAAPRQTPLDPGRGVAFVNTTDKIADALRRKDAEQRGNDVLELQEEWISV